MRNSAAGGAVINGKQDDSIRTQLARELQPGKWGRNAGREIKVHGSAKEARALLEERALFREENLEALVHGVLRLVTFKLAEIRVDGEIEHQAVVDDQLAVKTGSPAEMVAGDEGMVRVALIERTKRASDSVWIQLKIAPRRDAAETP